MKVNINDNIFDFNIFSSGFSSNVEVLSDEIPYIRLSKLIIPFEMNDVISTFKLISDDSRMILDFSNLPIDYTKINTESTKFINIVMKTRDIYEWHERILTILDYDMKFSAALRCYNLPLTCNLKCEYCAQDTNKRILTSFDHNLDTIHIDKEYDIASRTLTNYQNLCCDRYMGGETFLDWNKFMRTVDFYSGRHYCNNPGMEIYTNVSVPGSIDKLVNFIETNGYYKHYEIWFTIDTLNVSKSQRFTTSKYIETVLDNIERAKVLIDKSNVLTTFNVMYIDHNTTLDMVKWIKSQGFKHFKFAVDECNYSDEFMRFKHNDANKTFFECKKYLIPSEKQYRDNYLVYYFNVTELGNCVYTSKYNFLGDRNYTMIYIPYKE